VIARNDRCAFIRDVLRAFLNRVEDLGYDGPEEHVLQQPIHRAAWAGARLDRHIAPGGLGEVVPPDINRALRIHRNKIIARGIWRYGVAGRVAVAV
jgi:hypothetical protein